MYKKMIMAGLAARPVRTTVSILAVTLEVTLILVVVGLTAGISDETVSAPRVWARISCSSHRIRLCCWR